MGNNPRIQYDYTGSDKACQYYSQILALKNIQQIGQCMILSLISEEGIPVSSASVQTFHIP